MTVLAKALAKTLRHAIGANYNTASMRPLILKIRQKDIFALYSPLFPDNLSIGRFISMKAFMYSSLTRYLSLLVQDELKTMGF